MQNELTAMRRIIWHKRMTLFPIFVAACEVCCCEVNKQNHIWGEATAVSIKSLASCCPSILEADAVVDGCPPCYTLLLHWLCCKCWQQFTSSKEIIWFTSSSLATTPESCMSLVKWCPCKTARQNNSFPLNTIAIVLWCEITEKNKNVIWEITVPLFSMYCACPTAFPNQ